MFWNAECAIIATVLFHPEVLPAPLETSKSKTFNQQETRNENRGKSDTDSGFSGSETYRYPFDGGKA